MLHYVLTHFDVCSRPAAQRWVLEAVGTAEWTGVPLAYLLGMPSVTWLESIDVMISPFGGQQHVAYRYQDTADDVGTPVSRIRIRSLMLPPGIPDLSTRKPVLPQGPVVLQGREGPARAR